MSESKWPLLPTRQPPQRVTHQAGRPPVIERHGADSEIEINSALIPYEDGPFQPSAFAGQGNFRERGQQRVAGALSARFWNDKKILEVKAACGQEGGIVVKEKREADRPVSGVGKE